MPWRSKTVENLRKEFVLSANESTNLSALCREFGITRKTGYKWVKRYGESTSLSDKSRAPNLIANKKRLKNSSLTKPYYGCCYAGVEEFIIPLHYNGLLVCSIHISGYRGGLERSQYKMKNISKQCTKQFPELYSELSTDIPSMDMVLSFVKPLEYMLTDLYCECQKTQNKCEKTTVSEKIYIQSLNFIHENYSGLLNCNIIAEHCNYSPSYIRYIFKKAGNISVQSKITQIRLHKAKQLICTTNMSISEIAFSVGYNDSNYFSYAFKKHIGMSPKAYRESSFNF